MADTEEQQQQQLENQSENAMDTTDTAASSAGDEDDRKLFAGGLPQDAKEADIREYFGQFGDIESVNLKTDQHTGRSRGFCFVLYKAAESLEKAVALEEHKMKNKKVAVKKAQAKQGKVYVGKLKPEITDDEIKEFFEGYGAIAAVEQPFDKMKNERKNFCFITFEKEEPAKKLLKEGSVTIKGHELDVKKVTPKADNNMRGGGFGGRGGGRGGGQGGMQQQQQWAGYGGQQAGGWGGYGGYGDYGGWGGYGPEAYYGGGGGWGGYGGQQAGGWGYGGGAGGVGYAGVPR